MMLKTRKLTAALVAAGVLSASMFAAPALAQVSVTSGGTAAFVPYYTINDGWRTLLNVTNTSENSLAVKVRLHEARNSRDVLDFVVLLSPFDVWTAWIQEGADGQPRLQTNDRSCTVPLSVRDSGASASALAYSRQFRDHTATDDVIERMSEGYIEILVMGETEGEGIAPPVNSNRSNVSDNTDANWRGSTAWFAKHVNGEPRNCDLIQNDFVRRTASWTPGPASAPNPMPGDDGSASPLARWGSVSEISFQGRPAGTVSQVGYEEIVTPNPLKVNVSLVNQSKGVAAGVDAFLLPEWGLGENLVTAQQFPWFLEPALASGFGLWNTEYIEEISDVFTTGTVANEWTNNPNTGAEADWVVTFPGKRFQADEDALNIQAACSVWRNEETAGGDPEGVAGAIWDGWTPVQLPGTGWRPRQLQVADNDDTGLCPDLGFPTVFQDGNNGVANLVVKYDIYDREEGFITVDLDGPVISPAPPPDVVIDNLPYEVNVLRVGRNAANLPSALDSLIALAIDTSQLPSNANQGWMRMTFEDARYTTTGFIFKTRNFGNPALNFGSANVHGYDDRGSLEILP